MSTLVIGVAPDGAVHALWGDSIDGAKHAALAVTQMVWSPQRALLFVFGLRNNGEAVVSVAPAECAALRRPV